MIIIFACIVASALLLALYFLELIITPARKIPVLMYHRIGDTICNRHTVTNAQLERQLRYLQQKGYHSITSSQLIDYLDNKISLPPKPVLISFDDGHNDILKYAYPLLQKYSMKALIFLPTVFMGRISYLREAQLKDLDTAFIEFGLHSHQSYAKLPIDDIQKDLSLCFRFFYNYQIPFAPVFAYPHGARPKDHYELKRIEIRGDESFRLLTVKIKNGRARIFELFR